MTPGAAMDEAEIYTVRVWRHGGQWRAAVRAVGDERTQLFSAPAPLADWLLRQDEHPAAAAGPATTAFHHPTHKATP